MELCKEAIGWYHSIIQRRGAVDNLGLLGTARHYWRIQRKDKKSRKYEQVFEAFDSATSGDLKEILSQRMSKLNETILTQTDFQGLVTRTLTRDWLRKGRDEITSCDLYLPTLPRVESDQYADIIEGVIRYFRAAADPLEKSRDAFQAVYQKLLTLEASSTEFAADHELTRCLFYLGLPQQEGDQRAYDCAVESATRFPKAKFEFLYVALWAARRLRKFEMAHQLACEAIDEDSGDPRFYHGRSLNNFSWFSDRKQRSTWKLSGDLAVKDLKAAIRLYRKKGDRYLRVIGAAYCNQAYFLLLDENWGVYSLSEAVESLDKLKDYVDRTEWDPLYPEYFGAEAMVRYHEYLGGLKREEPREYLEDKLSQGLKSILVAIRLFERQRFYELKGKVQQALVSMPGLERKRRSQ